MSETTKEKIRQKIIGQPQSKQKIEKCRNARLTQTFPKKDSFLEKQAQSVMKTRGIPFITHKAILGQPDIFIEPNICIFLDGCYWHGCQIHHPNKHQDRYYADFRIKQTLELEGYKTIRIWEHDIAEFGQILDKIGVLR